MNKNVFIVHGQAHADRDDLAALVSDLGLIPKILEFERKSGGTIIEEFEKLARQCVFAFVLLTPDDKQAAELEEADLFRARQNVIFEMGWFFKALGRERVRLVHRDRVELPSDVTGIIYISYDKKIGEVRSKIREALTEGGL